VAEHLSSDTANMLLGFDFEEEEERVPKRRMRSFNYTPFNKQQYLQAAMHFRVLPDKDLSAHLCDPDELVSWKSVV